MVVVVVVVVVVETVVVVVVMVAAVTVVVVVLTFLVFVMLTVVAPYALFRYNSTVVGGGAIFQTRKTDRRRYDRGQLYSAKIISDLSAP